MLTGCNSNDEKERKPDDSNKVIEENSNSNSNDPEESNINIEYNEKDVGKYDVTLYLFYLDTCPHCHNEQEWLNDIKKDYKFLKIKKYEANKNGKIYDLVLEKMNIDSYYVPLNIIGNYYSTGFGEAKKEEYLNMIKKYSTVKHCDVVDAIINNKDVESCIKKNKSVDLSN